MQLQPETLALDAAPCATQTIARRAHSCSTVSIPARCRRASIDGPIPHRSRKSRACKACGKSACSITVNPSGLFMSDAVLARNLFGAMPIEQVRLSLKRSRNARLMSRAMRSALSRGARARAASTAPHRPTRGLAVRNARRDRLEELLVHLQVARRPRDLQRDVGATLQRFGHAGAGLDAVQFLGFLARGDAAGGRARHRDHRHRPSAQVRRVVLFHRREEGVEIDEQAAQRHRNVRLGNAVSVGTSPRPARISPFH